MPIPIPPKLENNFTAPNTPPFGALPPFSSLPPPPGMYSMQPQTPGVFDSTGKYIHESDPISHLVFGHS